MSIVGNKNHLITLLKVVELTNKFRKQIGSRATLGGYIKNSSLYKTLNQEKCIEIKCYYGIGIDAMAYRFCSLRDSKLHCWQFIIIFL